MGINQDVYQFIVTQQFSRTVDWARLISCTISRELLHIRHATAAIMTFLLAGLLTDRERHALKSTLLVAASSITETPLQSSKHISVWPMSESISLCRSTASLQAPRVNEYIATFVVCVS